MSTVDTCAKSQEELSFQLATENEKRGKKTAARLEAHAWERDELLAAGLNPYEVFRRREVEAAQQAVQAEASALQRMRQEQTLAKIVAEDLRLRK